MLAEGEIRNISHFSYTLNAFLRLLQLAFTHLKTLSSTLTTYINFKPFLLIQAFTRHRWWTTEGSPYKANSFKEIVKSYIGTSLVCLSFSV